MTQAAGAREQTASPWKHMLASVSVEEPAALHWNCCMQPNRSLSPRGGGQERRLHGEELLLSDTSCYAQHVKDRATFNETCTGERLTDGRVATALNSDKGM